MGRVTTPMCSTMADMPEISVTLGSTNILANNPAELSQFWAQVTGGTAHHNADDVYLAPDRPAGFPLFFHKYEGDVSALPAERVHVDLTVPWGAREEVVRQLVAIGATWQWDVLDEHPHVRWTTLTDPEGNYLCIAEHPPAGS